ncbi:hypothetical protein LB559_06390 [Mesorhizobium sp. BR1-1-3]|uniref:hypothetical protein n=1 Tax=unclassified Mesorhizobium TaxID=325217 RepID=UPI000F75C413|nr:MULTISPECIES: hypothetical protein [unclassified Mesorhizobium]AZO45296.1 hypothetical protein EJ076_31455 [Mesorhizobium sp. M7D.F.Ca.US.005.01.1.1]MBZ9887567.1 hypothetical protein [Mesorhizobium sp. BR1-1-3]
MSLSVLKAAADAENADGLHLARLLVLLRSADKRGKSAPKPIEGITKLAKLDFLLRYPVYLERALEALDKSPADAAVLPRERTTVETKMIRFRYGPWDGRYRRWLSLLSSRDLITLSFSGRKIEIGLTERGRALADDLANRPTFKDFETRGAVLMKAVGAMSATKLKDFVYEIVPEIAGMKWGAEIGASDPAAETSAFSGERQ